MFVYSRSSQISSSEGCNSQPSKISDNCQKENNMSLTLVKIADVIFEFNLLEHLFSKSRGQDNYVILKRAQAESSLLFPGQNEVPHSILFVKERFHESCLSKLQGKCAKTGMYNVFKKYLFSF